jgi:hypothetical protein
VVNCVGNGYAVLMKTSPSHRRRVAFTASASRRCYHQLSGYRTGQRRAPRYWDGPQHVINVAAPPSSVPQSALRGAWLHHRRRRTQQAPGGYSTSTSAQDNFAIIIFLLPWVCGDQLLSSLHNFKYHLLECNNPGMASTAGGVQRGESQGLLDRPGRHYAWSSRSQ